MQVVWVLWLQAAAIVEDLTSDALVQVVVLVPGAAESLEPDLPPQVPFSSFPT